LYIYKAILLKNNKLLSYILICYVLHWFLKTRVMKKVVLLLGLAICSFLAIGQKATISWNGSVSSDWNIAANWNGGVVPGPGDDAFITLPSPNQPVINGTVPAINSLTIDASRSLTINGNITVTGYISHGGIITINGSGVLTISGSLTVNTGGSITSNGVLKFGGSTSASFSGTANITGSGSVEVASARTLNIDGDLSVNTSFNHSGIINVCASRTLTVSGCFTAGVGSTINISSTGSGGLFLVHGSLVHNSSNTITVNSGGSLRFGSTGGSFSGNATVSGSGSVEVMGGRTLDVDGNLVINTSFSHSGIINIYANRTVTVNGSFTSNSGSSINISTSGSGGVFLVNGSFTYNSSNLINVNTGGFLRFGGTSGSFSGSAAVSGSGTVEVLSGRTLEIDGTLTINTGFSHSGIINVNASRTLIVSGSFSHYGSINVNASASAGGTLTVNGTFHAYGGSVLHIYRSTTVSATFNANAEVTTDASSVITVDGRFNASFSGIFHHAGSLDINVDSFFDVFVDVDLENYGEINVNATGSASGTASISGSFTAKNGSTLTIYRSSTVSATFNANGSFEAESGSTIHIYGKFNASASVTFSGNATLHAGSETSFTGSAVLISTSSSLVLEANASGSASVTCAGSVSCSGSVTVQLYLTRDRWHYFSSPVANATAFIFLNDYLKKYDEPTDSWISIVTNDPLDASRGYQVWKPSSTSNTEEFQGPLNNGSMPPLPLTRTMVPSLGQYNGWNLVGNPYPSAVDLQVTAGWSWSHVGSTAYYWDGTLGRYAAWNWSGSGSGQNGGTRYVPSSQGFFVHCNAIPPETGSYEINNLARVHSSQTFWKSSEIRQISNELRLWAGDATGDLDELVIRFVDGSSPAFDDNFDAYKLYGSQPVQVYGRTTDNVSTAIYTVPVMADNTLVPVSILPAASGSFKLSAYQLYTFTSGSGILLEDLKTGMVQDLTIDSVYSFTSDIQDDPNRFILLFSGVYYVGSNPMQENSLNKIFGSGNSIYIIARENVATSSDVFVYDLLGRQVYRNKLSAGGVAKFSIEVPQGYYFVKVISGSEISSAKVYLQ
jgi:hypothetical protein